MSREPAALRESFWNGRWVPHEELHIAIDDLGFVQGVTAVERMRTYGGRVFQIARHLQRFATTVTALGIAGIPDRKSLQELIEELLRRNGPWLHRQREASIVLFATPGSVGKPALRLQHPNADASDPAVPEDASPTWCIYLSPLPWAVIEHRTQSGQPLVVTDVVQPSVQSWPRHLKVRSRLHYFLADRQATAINPDALGILLDEDRTVTETSIANLAVVQSGCIVSPPAARILPGVTQAVAEDIAAELKIEWQKRPLSIQETHAADEVLLFGTTSGIWPGWLLPHSVEPSAPFPIAASLRGENRQVVPGPVFQALRTRFDACCVSDSGPGSTSH